YWKDFEANYDEYDSWWEVDDQTKNVKALTGLTPTNGMKIDKSSISNNAYTITTEGDVFQIHYVKTSDYEKFGFSWMDWAYPECDADNWQLVNPLTGEDWGAGKDCHRTAKGYSIDFSDPANRLVSFKYQAKGDAAINLRVDLWDIKGRKTTKEGYICTDGLERTSTFLPNDENAWQDFDIIYADENVPEAFAAFPDEFASAYWYGTCSGVLADGNNTWWNGIQFPSTPTFPLYLDPSRIIGLEIYINCDVTTKGQTSDIYIKDLTVGNPENAEEFTAIQSVEANSTVEITNGVVYSAGAITVFDVLGHKVKSGKEELSIKDLPAGFYFIQTAEGTTKFVK
ncbi:MAG: T9SS type A sorting domain-containing protein, partial [Bacteroidales bacterium]|nr:T9SS type A sorting domain-containing protein [Bacteroidales bacterium]